MVVGEFTQEANLVILGAGPGGYSAAFRAAELGLNPVIVDSRKDLGGVCVHAGCVTSKALLHISEMISLAKRASALGVEYPEPRIDLDRIRAWVNQSADQLAAGLMERAQKLGVEVIHGRAAFDDGRNLSVHGGSVPRVQFRRAIVAVGARPAPHPAAEFDGQLILEPWQALKIERVPARLLVVGSAASAVEIASIYASLGSAVTLAFEESQCIPEADADIVLPLARQLGDRLEALMPGATIAEVNRAGGGVDAKITIGGRALSLHFNAIVMAIGQRGNTDDLGLDATRIRCDGSGFVPIDEQMRTAETRIFAVGDVTGPPWTADRALAQGRIAAEVAAGWNSAFDARAVPRVCFTDPQIAWCGLTESQAQTLGAPFKVARIPWGSSGRALGMNRTDGLTKLIYDADTRLVLGVGIVGAGAAEMIGEGALAVEMGVELDDLAGTIHPHPSMCELLSDAAR